MNRYVVATAAVTLLIVGAAFAFALRDGANHASSAGPVPTVEGSSASEKPAAPSADGQAALTTTASLATATVPASVRLGTWQRLPAAPIAVPYTRASVWTGTEMLIFGRVTSLKGGFATGKYFDVAAAYNPATETWRKLHPGPGFRGGSEGHDEAVWTGSEMLVTGITNAAYKPATNHWRLLPAPPEGWGAPAFTVWTGRQLIGWGGGCCGDSNAWGAAYTPATNSWEMLPPAPLAGRQGTVGAWTGTELIIVGGNDADGKVFATAAAYNPATLSWRRLPPLPAPRTGATATWDGTEVLVVGGRRAGMDLYADGVGYNPSTNRWRRLPAMGTSREGHVAVWTGSRLLVWGGGTIRGRAFVAPPHGLAYDPVTNRWSPLPVSPLRGRFGATAVWTGAKMILWGGRPVVYGSGALFADGAAYTPGKL
jgi:hypothetical protein